MRKHSPIMLIFVMLGAAACHSSKPTTQLKPSDAARRNEWKASLFTPSELAGVMQVRGTATWSPDGDAASLVTVNMSNATSGGLHPWHIHRGRCGDNGPVVGDAAAYKPLTVDEKGSAAATAHLNVAMPREGNYYVNVHALATNMATIISCGNLAPPVS